MLKWKVWVPPERIEQLIKAQPFLAPSPPPPPPSRQWARSKTYRKTEKERRSAKGRRKREWEGGGRGAESYDCKIARPSINHSILSKKPPRLWMYVQECVVTRGFMCGKWWVQYRITLWIVGTNDFEAQISGMRFWKGDENLRPLYTKPFYEMLSGCLHFGLFSS
jgi:hypothetical protein